jgi:ABC-type branched-subunit amino acid transport system ATPase component
LNGLLYATDLRKAFGGLRAVDGVTAFLEPGEVVAVVGPNGAGKSTLLNLLSGQLVPDSGNVFVRGTDVTRLTASHRSRRPVVRGYQDGGIFPRLSALKNVMVPAVARGIPHRVALKRAREVLELLGLGTVADERADRLSGGQRKLLDVGRCFTVDASLALLDEPTAGVNMAISEIIRNLIMAHKQDGMAFMIVSHDLPWAFRICTRVLVLSLGRIIAAGQPSEIVTDPHVIEAYLA